MKSQARVVVIGGGAVGVATLYHLTKKGWSDVVLLERKELTSGSTWHAAGLLPLFNMSYSVGQIHKYSVALYKRLEEETGQDVGLRQCSNIRLALNRDRMDEYHQYAGVAETIGVTVEFLTPAAGQGALAALQHRGRGRRDPPSRGRLHPAGRRHSGDGAGRARRRRRDLPPDPRSIAIEQKPLGRVAGQDRPGRHRVRARGLGDRQLRAPDRRHGRARRAR